MFIALYKDHTTKELKFIIKAEDIEHIFFLENNPELAKVYSIIDKAVYEGYLKQETIDKLLSQTNIPQFT